MRSHRALLWAIAAAHLAAAGLTWNAGVPIATPIVLALAALAAFGLGTTQSAHPADDHGHPQLGRAETPTQPAETGPDQPGPAATGGTRPSAGHRTPTL